MDFAALDGGGEYYDADRDGELAPDIDVVLSSGGDAGGGDGGGGGDDDAMILDGGEEIAAEATFPGDDDDDEPVAPADASPPPARYAAPAAATAAQRNVVRARDAPPPVSRAAAAGRGADGTTTTRHTSSDLCNPARSRARAASGALAAPGTAPLGVALPAVARAPLPGARASPFPQLHPSHRNTWLWPSSAAFPDRVYQLQIASVALFQNTLVSLPTGLGKTFLAGASRASRGRRRAPRASVPFLCASRQRHGAESRAASRSVGETLLLRRRRPTRPPPTPTLPLQTAAVVMRNYYRWFPEGQVVFIAPTKPLVAQQVRPQCRV